MKFELKLKKFDLYRRKFVVMFLLKKMILSIFLKNRFALPITILLANFYFHQIRKSTARNIFSNRCLFSGRNHSVNLRYKYSRFFFRSLSYKALLAPTLRYSK